MVNTMELKAKFGNHKLGEDILIFNMGTAKACPSLKLGMCNAVKTGVKCYALKPEIQYKDRVVHYRTQQKEYWDSTSATKIANDIVKKIWTRRGKATKYFRFNEASDFHSQKDVDKLSKIAYKLKNFNIITFGFTSRKDLDFTDVNFLVKGSGFTIKTGGNGTTTIVKKGENIPTGFFQCKESCKICDYCMTNDSKNIAFKQH